VGDANFEFRAADVFSTVVDEALRKADVVIPLAALVGAPLCEKDKPRPGSQPSRRRRHRPPTVPQGSWSYPNTNSGYGQTDGTSFVTEDDPLTPISVYGETKCAAEKAVLDHPNGIAFRLATVFGAFSPRMRLDLMVNDFTYRLCELKRVLDRPGRNAYAPLSIFEPHFKRNFVGVQDVCRAFVHMLTYTGPRGRVQPRFAHGQPDQAGARPQGVRHRSG
jgi:nucleoside-diphosphate-sugar epimerase